MKTENKKEKKNVCPIRDGSSNIILCHQPLYKMFKITKIYSFHLSVFI